jgi:tetratricopeptide (TPR) repeat protein
MENCAAVRKDHPGVALPSFPPAGWLIDRYSDMLDQGAQEKGRGRPQSVSVAKAAIVLWVLLVAVLAYRWLAPADAPARSTPPPRAPTGFPAQSAPPGADQALAALVAERTAELRIKPKTAATPSDLALEAAVAIKGGNFARAEQISDEVLTNSRMQNWRFYPFNAFMGSVARGDDPVLLAHLDTWLKQQPKSPVAYLIRAAYYSEAAWAARGNDVARNVPARLMRQFEEDMDRSRADIEKSISLNPRNPLSYYELLLVASGDGDSPDVEKVFQTGITAYPNYYPLYKTRLDSLAPKWGGSIDAMYAFVDRYAGGAANSSPLKLLYLNLYATLLEAAAFDCGSLSGDGRELCVKDSFEHLTRRGLADGMVTALNLYKVSDPIQFSTAVWPILETISCNRCIGSPAAAGGVLQIAASIMGSDNRMMDEPTHNSYVLDDITARVWAQMDNPANVDKKFHEALSDVDNTKFPDEADKAQAMAAIFDHMAAFADDTSQFIDVIVYQDAANAVGGINHGDTPYRKCYAYYRMKHFAAAVKECSALIEGNGNYMQTHYWRGKAYEGLGQWDASIADFSPVADGADNWFRVGAALDMSYDFGQKGDYAGQIASMNEHAYLFDTELQPPHDIAVAYNNRCFAHMKLGQFREALDDCTMSLKFDRMPDAFHKQQELLKLLGVKTSI